MRIIPKQFCEVKGTRGKIFPGIVLKTVYFDQPVAGFACSKVVKLFSLTLKIARIANAAQCHS